MINVLGTAHQFRPPAMERGSGLPHASNRGKPPPKLEYTNKEEADAARIQIAKGEFVFKVSSATLLYGIEKALVQAIKAGQNLGQSETSLT
jgi:hypothetical protein